MAIKVQFPVGESNVTVRGLYQWDYGQVLEIECAELGSEVVEVHFACPNMSEAIVRTCTFSNGAGTVPLPDECLEQTSSITAWICRRDSAQRHTIKTIVLPLTARTRPGNMLDDVPASRADAVGQLIEEVNEAIDALESGNVVAAKATTADTAGHATTAGSASNATYATSAGSANKATTATTATTANSVTASLEVSLEIVDGKGTASSPLMSGGGVYIVAFNLTGGFCASGLLYVGGAIHTAMVGKYLITYYGNVTDTGEIEYIVTVSDTGDNSNKPSGTIKLYKIGGAT